MLEFKRLLHPYFLAGLQRVTLAHTRAEHDLRYFWTSLSLNRGSNAISQTASERLIRFKSGLPCGSAGRRGGAAAGEMEA